MLIVFCDESIMDVLENEMGANWARKETSEGMKRVLELESPDLVVLGGDTLSNNGASGPKVKPKEWVIERWSRATSAMVDAGVPWAIVLGNHDYGTAVSGVQLAAHDASINGSLTSSENDVNYRITILNQEDDKPAANLWFFNSHYYGCLEIDQGAGCITPTNIDWYRRESASLKKVQNATLPGMAFFHIPPPEMMSVFNAGQFFGNAFDSDGVCCSTLNTGLIASMMDLQNVQTVTFGHDHGNDFFGRFGQSLTLAYGRKSGFGSYNQIGMKQGARVYEIQVSTSPTELQRDTSSETGSLSERPVPDSAAQLHEAPTSAKGERYLLRTWIRLVDDSTPPQRPGIPLYRLTKCCAIVVKGLVVNIALIVAVCVLFVLCVVLVGVIVYLRFYRHRHLKMYSKYDEEAVELVNSTREAELETTRSRKRTAVRCRGPESDPDSGFNAT